MSSAASSAEPETQTYKIFSSHDPACDQCRIKKIGCGRELPTCSNCLKSRVPCVRSNRGKKPNQTNKLVSDVQQFGKQLNDVERKVNGIHARLDEFLRRPNESPTENGFERNNREPMVRSLVIQPATGSSPGGGQSLSDGHVAFNNSSTDRPLRTSSLMSLFEEADEKINQQLDVLRPRAALRDILSTERPPEPSPPLLDAFLAFKADVYGGLSLSSDSCSPDLTHDETPLLLPPRQLLEPIIEPYFRHIAAVSPVVGRIPCLEAVKKHYSSGMTAESLDPAWIILFNYIILYCLVGRYMPLDRPSSDIDITSIPHIEKPFVTNIRRSFGVIHKLLAPKLVNVQALVALTLTSQKYFSEYVTQYLVNQACFVAKSMGLHRQGYADGDLSAEDRDERRRVFCNLFNIDKDVALLLGTPPNLHHYDCDVAYPVHTSYDFLRRVDSGMILNKIHVLLYSASANRTSPMERENHIGELLRLIDDLQRAIDDASLDESDPMYRAWQFLGLEQRHTAQHARLMVLRRSGDPSKYERRLHAARECIKTISRIHVARTTVGGFMVLRRPFQWRPFAPFFELLPTIFQYPMADGQLADLTLLKDLIDVLRVVASADGPSSYCGKLARITTGCIQLAEEFIQHCLRHQNAAPTGLPPINGGILRKRMRSSLEYHGDVPASKTRNFEENNLQQGEPHLSASPHPDSKSLTNVGWDQFQGGSMSEMFPGWPKTSTDGLAFLDEEFFWGVDEDLLDDHSQIPQ